MPNGKTWRKHGDRRDVPRLSPPDLGITRAYPSYPCGGPGHPCYFLPMARLPRVVIVDVPHHVTQRGNSRQVILASDADRLTYLELLREYSQLYALSLLGYCLMSNHVRFRKLPRLSRNPSNRHMDATRRTGTPSSRRPATYGRDDSIPVRWMNRISGQRCAMWG